MAQPARFEIIPAGVDGDTHQPCAFAALAPKTIHVPRPAPAPHRAGTGSTCAPAYRRKGASAPPAALHGLGLKYGTQKVYGAWIAAVDFLG